MKRKTFDVSEFKNFVNKKLSERTISDEEKRGMRCLLEEVLVKTGNYRGFNHVYWWSDGGYIEWLKDGEPDFPIKDRYIYGNRGKNDVFYY